MSWQLKESQLQMVAAERHAQWQWTKSEKDRKRYYRAVRALERHIAEANPMKIYQKMLEIQKSLKAVPKNGFNSFHKYNYVTKADVLQAVSGPCAEQGIVHYVTVLDTTIDSGCAFVKVELTLVDAETGEKVTVVASGYSEDKKGDKAVFKAQTGASKYAYLQAFGLATDDDPENEQEAKPASKPTPDTADLKTQKAMKEYREMIGQIMEQNQLSKEDMPSITGYPTLEGADLLMLENAFKRLVSHIEQRGVVA